MKELIHDFHSLEEHFFSLVSINCIAYPSLLTFETGVLAAGLNPAFVKKINDHFAQDVTCCKAYYEQKNLPWTLIIPEYALIYPEQDHLLTQDYELIDIGVAMTFQLLANHLNKQVKTNQLQFKEMNEDLPTWSIPLIHGFNSTTEITNVYTLRHHEAQIKNKNIYHFSGFYKDEVAVSVTLTVKDNHARIDDLATMPKFQKRGFASALIEYALIRALDLNVQTCFLEASNAGLNLYRRIGFQPLFTNHYYELLSKISRI